MFHQPTWASGSYSRGPQSAGIVRSLKEVFTIQYFHPVAYFFYVKFEVPLQDKFRIEKNATLNLDST